MAFVTYAAAVNTARRTLTHGYLQLPCGATQALGANTEPTQGELLLAVLGAHSLFSDEEELENSYVQGGVSALAAYCPEQGAYVSWVVTWHTHPESGLYATFTSNQLAPQVLVYTQDEGALPAPLAALLNASRWRVLG